MQCYDVPAFYLYAVTSHDILTHYLLWGRHSFSYVLFIQPPYIHESGSDYWPLEDEEAETEIKCMLTTNHTVKVSFVSLELIF